MCRLKNELSSFPSLQQRRRRPTLKYKKYQGWTYHPPPQPSNSTFQALSYKAKLVGQLRGAYEKAFSLIDQMQEDAESNVKEENVDEGDIVLTLSREDKIRIRS